MRALIRKTTAQDLAILAGLAVIISTALTAILSNL